MKDLFDREMLDRFNKAMESYPVTDLEHSVKMRNELSDSNAGAIYKLRAVKDNKGKWISRLHCGITGAKLWESFFVYDSPEAALVNCFNRLKSSIMKIPVPAELLESLTT